jgi:hypothetical protein
MQAQTSFDFSAGEGAGSRRSSAVSKQWHSIILDLSGFDSTAQPVDNSVNN